MDADQRQHYNLLMQSRGNRQYIGNPVDFGWLYLVSSHSSTGVDISLPAGTEIHAGQDGVVSVDHDTIIITRADGVVSKYARLGSILVSDGQTVKTGDVIGTSGGGLILKSSRTARRSIHCISP